MLYRSKAMEVMLMMRFRGSFTSYKWMYLQLIFPFSILEIENVEDSSLNRDS